MSKSEQFMMHLDNLNVAISFFENECKSGIRDSDDLDWIIDKVEYREDIDEVVIDFKQKKIERWWEDE